MLKSFPFVPLGITVGVMGADGLVASYDIDKNGGTPPSLLKSKTLWLQGAALASGLIGEIAGWHPDITEPLMLSGAGLMAREGAFSLAQRRQSPPVPGQGYRAKVAAPARAAGWEAIPRAAVHPQARPSVNVQGTGQRQPVTSAG